MPTGGNVKPIKADGPPVLLKRSCHTDGVRLPQRAVEVLLFDSQSSSHMLLFDNIRSH